MKEIDCRGLNCPEPVLRTKAALTENPVEDLKIIVDNETARENVLRFIRNLGTTAEWLDTGGSFTISISGSTKDISRSGLPAASAVETNNSVLFISTDQLGLGSSELGQILMRNFIYTLTKRDDLPRAVVLMNSGAKLSINESPVLDELKELEAGGVNILVCGTCLDYYELKELHQVGQVSNMYDITDLLLSAKRVVSI